MDRVVLSKNNDKFIKEWHREAQRLLNRGNLKQAQRLCLRILDACPRHADAHFLIAMIAAARREVSGAIDLIKKAIELDAERAEYHAHLGRCLVMLKHYREAVEAADRAMDLKPTDSLTLDTIGCVYSYTGNHEKAVVPFRRAVGKKPDDPTFQFNLAASLKFLGDFDGAESAYEGAIQASPRFYRAHWALSTLRQQTSDKNHIKRLEQLLPSSDRHVDTALYLRHALAKEYDDIGDYEHAFRNLAAANTKKARQINYSIENDRQIFRTIHQNFDDRTVGQASTGHPASEPIFVVGMPRTGTTLAERILSNHSEVFPAGELQNFPILLKKTAQTTSNKVLDPETIEKAMKLDFRFLGSEYLQSTRPATGHTKHFIDKLPINFLYIGFIHLCLPNAKIICLRRNPMDTCLSNFRQLFAVDFGPYYDYAYDIMDTGRYYALFHGLMEHWRRVLPGRVLEVHYEKIVADQEAESRRMIEFCGLEWEHACLAFEKNTAAVATASSVQVRKPIYNTAIGRWKRYEKQLLPLQELLESECIPAT